jgi:hypothetical protein
MNTIFNNGTHQIKTAGRLPTEEESAYLGDIITKRSFMQRLSQSERIAIRSSTDESVIDIHEDLKSVDTVTLSNTDVISSLNYLTSVGILADGRSSTILTNPVEAHEI